MSNRAGCPSHRPAISYERWESLLPALVRQYRENQPCPHILLKDFLDPESALSAAMEFPQATSDAWTQYKHATKTSWACPSVSSFRPCWQRSRTNSTRRSFVAWVSELTGIPGLMADPMLEGGGLHQSGPGGYLNVHTDFSMHHFHTHWHRRVNLILYLNPGWQEEWAVLSNCGAEGWEDGTLCGEVSPLLNHALIFTTDERSLHGFPILSRAPRASRARAWLCITTTLERGRKVKGHSTDYFARPRDGRGNRR